MRPCWARILLVIAPGILLVQMPLTGHEECYSSELCKDELRIGGEHWVHPMNCTRHRLPNGHLSMKVHAGAGFCSRSAVAISLDEDGSSRRISASSRVQAYWLCSGPLSTGIIVLKWGHLYIKFYDGFLSLLDLLYFHLFISFFLHKILLWKNDCSKMPKWPSNFHIGNSKMVLLYI